MSFHTITLVTGGARSGKSDFAETLTKELAGESAVYLATAAICDEEMAERVKQHQARRPAAWKTIERYQGFDSREFAQSIQGSKALLLDCVGFLLNNLMYDKLQDREDYTHQEMEEIESRMEQELGNLIHATRAAGVNLVVVTNEVGMGIVPADRMTRYYRDILGRANRLVAKQAASVYLLVAGIPLQIK